MRSTNIIRLTIHAAILVIVCLVLLPAIAAAHGGEEHVIGTVKVSGTSVTVKTTAGKAVEVGFDSKMTTYERARQPIQRTDIRVGGRIVIHATEANEKLVAHTVEVGPAAKH